LVREVAAERKSADLKIAMQHELIAATCRVYPSEVYRDPATWPRARRLDAFAVALVDREIPKGSEIFAAILLSGLENYRDGALGAYTEAQKLSERALEIIEGAFGPDHPATATALSNLAELRRVQDDFAGARQLLARALAIRENAFGPDHEATAECLSNLGIVLRGQGDLAEARSLHERALAIFEKALGRDHPSTAASLNNIGVLLCDERDHAGARLCYERALTIREKRLGPNIQKRQRVSTILAHFL
jgi:tetratricopeptide (TPR) repeat protein